MKLVFLFPALFAGLISFCQSQQSAINIKEVERIERALSSDEMKGRPAAAPGNDKAAQFIANEFKKVGVSTWNKSSGYLQSFQLVEPKLSEIKGEMNDEELDPKRIFVVTTKPELEVNEKSGYEYKTISAGANMMQEAWNILSQGKRT